MIELNPRLLRRMLMLRRVPMFATTELAELALLAENALETSFAPGAVIAAAGAHAPALHFVVDGGITAAGIDFGPLEVFGGLHVLAQRVLHSPAIATRPTRTLQVLAPDVTEVLEESLGVLRATLQELATRVLAGNIALETIAVPDSDPLGFVDRLMMLRRAPLFAGARADGLAMLAHTSQEVTFPAGAIIARAGDVAGATYLIAEGRVGGLVPGAAIAPLEILAERAHGETLEATTRVRVLEIATTAVYDAIEDHPDLGLAIVSNLASRLLDA